MGIQIEGADFEENVFDRSPLVPMGAPIPLFTGYRRPVPLFIDMQFVLHFCLPLEVCSIISWISPII